MTNTKKYKVGEAVATMQLCKGYLCAVASKHLAHASPAAKITESVFNNCNSISVL